MIEELIEASELLSLLPRLHAMIMEARVSGLAKRRVRGQAGSRRDHLTTDQSFVRRTLLQQTVHAKRKLYCLFGNSLEGLHRLKRKALKCVHSAAENVIKLNAYSPSAAEGCTHGDGRGVWAMKLCLARRAV